MQKLPHLNLQLQVVMVPVQIEILLGFVSNATCVLVQCASLHPIFLHVTYSFLQFGRYLRVSFQVIKLSPIVHVTPIRLLFFCFRTVDMIGYKLVSKHVRLDLLCQANILRVSVLIGHDSVPLHEVLRMVHEIVPKH